MAEKGARHRLEGVAKQMYVDGKSLSEIAEALEVSRQTLTDWKARTKRGPGTGDQGPVKDEWDRAREQKKSNAQRLNDLFERQMTWIEEQPPHLVTAPMVDALSKLGALVKTGNEAARVVREVRAMVEAPEQKSVSAEDLRRIIRESYGV